LSRNWLISAVTGPVVIGVADAVALAGEAVPPAVPELHDAAAPSSTVAAAARNTQYDAAPRITGSPSMRTVYSGANPYQCAA
jgi:hypothetical protein